MVINIVHPTPSTTLTRVGTALGLFLIHLFNLQSFWSAFRQVLSIKAFMILFLDNSADSKNMITVP